MSKFVRSLDPELPMHVTGRCNNREPLPIPIEDAWEIFSDYLHIINGQFNIKIHAFVLMPNHFHLLCRDPDVNLPKAMAFFMRETSLAIGHGSGRINRIWGSRYFSSVISSPAYYLHAYKYLYRNPAAAKLCRKVESYQWSSLRFLIGMSKGHIPLENDETLFSDIEGTLLWLNSPYLTNESRLLKSALQRKVARIPIIRTTRKHHVMTFSSRGAPKNINLQSLFPAH